MKMDRPARVRGVVFDLDGTLLDALDDIRIGLNRTLERHGSPPRSGEEIARAVGDGARNLVARAMGFDALDDRRARDAHARVDAVLADYLAEYERDPTPATRVMPGAIELLDAPDIGAPIAYDLGIVPSSLPSARVTRRCPTRASSWGSRSPTAAS